MNRRVPRPLPRSVPEATGIRRPCPSCRTGDAEVLFQTPRCLNQECRFFDKTLRTVEEEKRVAEMRAWLAFIAGLPPYVAQ